MIENVVKATRRKQTVDEAFMEQLFNDVTSLYHLNEAGAMSGSKTDLGPLPKTAVLLLGTLAFTWLCILLYALSQRFKNHARSTQKSSPPSKAADSSLR